MILTARQISEIYRHIDWEDTDKVAIHQEETLTRVTLYRNAMYNRYYINSNGSIIFSSIITKEEYLKDLEESQ